MEIVELCGDWLVLDGGGRILRQARRAELANALLLEEASGERKYDLS